jgi:hypothetical protein|tara:strand:+ start:49 stop:1413 length:1365 start_codon:yes stop_codon:yes gene_type:complete
MLREQAQAQGAAMLPIEASSLEDAIFKGTRSYSDYMKSESAVEKELNKRGFLDPRDHKDHKETTHFWGLTEDGEDVPARRYWMKFEYRDVDTLIPDQVREQKTDKDWIKNKLYDRISRRGTLKYPIYITSAGYIVHGHHRWETWKEILKKNPDALNTIKIPVIVITGSYIVDEENKKVEAMVGTSSAFNNKVAQIAPNTPQENLPLNMIDTAISVAQLYELDPNMHGYNPGGKVFYDENNPKDKVAKDNFDNVMKRFFFNEFGPAQRTQIRKLVHKDISMKVEHTFDEVTAEFANLGWPTGVDTSGKNKRLDPREWTCVDPDPVRNPNGDKVILHRQISTAGIKHKQEVRDIIVDMYQEKTLHQISGFRVVLELAGKTRSTVISVNDKHFNDYIAKQLTGINNGSEAVDWPGILSVRCSKEVEDVRDVGMTADWDSELGAFVNRDTKKPIRVMA